MSQIWQFWKKHCHDLALFPWLKILMDKLQLHWLHRVGALLLLINCMYVWIDLEGMKNLAVEPDLNVKFATICRKWFCCICKMCDNLSQFKTSITFFWNYFSLMFQWQSHYFGLHFYCKMRFWKKNHRLSGTS